MTIAVPARRLSARQRLAKQRPRWAEEPHVRIRCASMSKYAPSRQEGLDDLMGNATRTRTTVSFVPSLPRTRIAPEAFA
jgi:hypothetical protein